jgi:zinc protease
MKVVLAERHDTPQVLIDMVVGGGYAADTPAKAGVASLAYNMLDEGTRTRDALQISSQLAGLGAAITTGPSSDFGSVSLSALKPTLDPALAIYADVILNPAFAQKDLDRLKRQQIAGIAQAKADPSSLASRLAPALIYGPQHPYGVVSSGTEASVAGLTTGDLAAYHQAWFKPNNATLVIVGDTTLAEITPKLERAFAGWRPGAVPSLSIAQVAPPQKPVVYLVDKPGALQSEIRVGVVAPPRSSPDQIAFEQLNSAFGGGFVSRINLNLREDKHWSYGARTGIRPTAGQRIFLVSAPVQTDKTKESLVEIRKEINDVLGPRPLTAAELATAQNNLTLTMPGRWETAGAVQGSIGEIVQYGLPDDYWATYADRVRGTTLQQVVGVTPRLISKDNLTWVIVGDRARIEQGVRDLNLGEVRIIDADGNPVR